MVPPEGGDPLHNTQSLVLNWEASEILTRLHSIWWDICMLLRASRCQILMAESVVQDLEQGSIYGLEKLWAFLAYSKVDLAAEGVQRDPKVTAVCMFCCTACN